MVLIFWRSWRNFQEFPKTPCWRGFLKKWSPTSFFGKQFTSDFPKKKNKVEIPYVLKKKLQVISLEKNNYVGFFFLVRKFFKGISHIKLKVSSIFGLNFLKKFTSDFPRKKKCVGIPYVLSKKN